MGFIITTYLQNPDETCHNFLMRVICQCGNVKKKDESRNGRTDKWTRQYLCLPPNLLVGNNHLQFMSIIMFLYFKFSCFDQSMFFQEPSVVLLPCIVSQRRFTWGSENNITSFSIPFHCLPSQRFWRQYHELQFYRYCHFTIVAKQLNYVFMEMHKMSESIINTLRLRQNGRHLPNDIFKCIFSNENIWISIKFSLKFVPEGPINNIPALV